MSLPSGIRCSKRLTDAFLNASCGSDVRAIQVRISKGEGESGDGDGGGKDVLELVPSETLLSSDAHGGACGDKGADASLLFARVAGLLAAADACLVLVRLPPAPVAGSSDAGDPWLLIQCKWIPALRLPFSYY